MEMRAFGRSGMRLSVLGFGCGAVGGLMVRGAPDEQERTVAKALAAGINYFDTAVLYGDGESERNLGRALRRLGARDAVVGTKVRLPPGDLDRVDATVAASLDGSLRRLGRERVDILHLHNLITQAGGSGALTPRQVLDEVVPAFEELRRKGKIGHLGLTAVGDTPAVRAAVDSGAFASAQVVYNMLNPSAGTALPPGYPAQDYGRLFDATQAAGTGVVGIRVLAGGALSGSMDRHPIAGSPPAPIGSAATYAGDVERARLLQPLVDDGFAASLAEAATRFAISHPAMGSILVGMATEAQFDGALAAVLKGPLPPEALARLAALQKGFAGAAR